MLIFFSFQEDVALMADDLKMSTKVKNAVLLRIGEKKILQDALTYVTQLCQWKSQ